MTPTPTEPAASTTVQPEPEGTAMSSVLHRNGTAPATVPQPSSPAKEGMGRPSARLPSPAAAGEGASAARAGVRDPSSPVTGNLPPVTSRLALGAILLLACCLRVVGLDREAYGNTYYAAAIKSMLTGWH